MGKYFDAFKRAIWCGCKCECKRDAPADCTWLDWVLMCVWIVSVVPAIMCGIFITQEYHINKDFMETTCTTTDIV